MGRRSSRGGSYCGIKAALPESEQGSWAGESDNGYKLARTWCGKQSLSTPRERGLSPRLVTCPKCSAAIGKAKLAKLGRVRLERMAEPINGYSRSSYELWIDDTLRGYVSHPTGWGGHWQLYRIKGPDERWSSYTNGPCVSGSMPHRWDAEKWDAANESHVFWPVHMGSKEAMAVAGLALHERGGLPTEAEQEAEHAKRHADKLERERKREREAEVRRIERERLAGVREERISTARAALESLEARDDLTNLERAGLEAIKALACL